MREGGHSNPASKGTEFDIIAKTQDNLWLTENLVLRLRQAFKLMWILQPCSQEWVALGWLEPAVLFRR